MHAYIRSCTVIEIWKPECFGNMLGSILHGFLSIIQWRINEIASVLNNLSALWKQSLVILQVVLVK